MGRCGQKIPDQLAQAAGLGVGLGVGVANPQPQPQPQPQPDPDPDPNANPNPNQAAGARDYERADMGEIMQRAEVTRGLRLSVRVGCGCG